MRGKTGGWVVRARHARLKIDARLQRRPRDHRRHGHRQRHRQVHGHGQRVRLGRSVLFAARHQQRDVLDRPARARVCSGARGDHRQRSAGRRTRKNARAPRKGRLPSRATAGAIPARELAAATRAPSGPSGGGGGCGGRRGGERQPVPGPRDSTGFARCRARGWRLSTSRLTLSKRRLRLCAGSALGRDRRATPRCSAAPWCSRRPTCASTTLTTCATATSPRRAWRRSRTQSICLLARRRRCVLPCALLPRRSGSCPLWQKSAREPHLWVARARCKPHGRESA